MTEGIIDIDGGSVETEVYPEEYKRFNQWMCRHPGQKNPFAPWTQPDAPAPCSKSSHDDCSECDCNAQYKWSYSENYRKFRRAKVPTVYEDVGGLAFIQLEEDPFLFVDGDDVRCPETGDIHPAFQQILEQLGVTYADVSTSGAGCHAYYCGDLPADETAAKWALDDEPWGANDDIPEIEIYSGKHVCVTTGQHLTDSPETVAEIDEDVLEGIIEKCTDYDPIQKHTITQADSDKYGNKNENISSVSDSDDIADDLQDCFDAIEALDSRDVAEETIVDELTDTSRELYSFLPTWGKSSDGGTANIVSEDFWADTGTDPGNGGPIQMALIDMGEIKHTQAERYGSCGKEFWKGYEHLREIGFNLPKPPYEEQESSGYFDVELNEFVDDDVFAGANAMLEACLIARERGLVDEDVDPPALALSAIADKHLDRETGIDDDVTRDQALWFYHNDIEREDG